jgi:hypothetical protein
VIPIIFSPHHARDNILAKAYCRLCEGALKANSPSDCAPSGYVELQGMFAGRFAAEVGLTLGRDLRFEFKERSEFTEPKAWFNSEPAAELLGEQREEDAGPNSPTMTGFTALPVH